MAVSKRRKQLAENGESQQESPRRTKPKGMIREGRSEAKADKSPPSVGYVAVVTLLGELKYYWSNALTAALCQCVTV